MDYVIIRLDSNVWINVLLVISNVKHSSTELGMRKKEKRRGRARSRMNEYDEIGNSAADRTLVSEGEERNASVQCNSWVLVLLVLKKKWNSQGNRGGKRQYIWSTRW